MATIPSFFFICASTATFFAILSAINLQKCFFISLHILQLVSTLSRATILSYHYITVIGIYWKKDLCMSYNIGYTFGYWKTSFICPNLDKTLFVLLCANGYFVRHFVMSTYMPYCNIPKERYLHNLQYWVTFCYRKTSFRGKICEKTTRKQ